MKGILPNGFQLSRGFLITVTNIMRSSILVLGVFIEVVTCPEKLNGHQFDTEGLRIERGHH